MQTKFIGIPFKIEAKQGLSQVEGLAKFSAAGIVLEFEEKYLGFIETGVKEIGIPLAEIMDIRFKKGFFKLGAKIEIYLNSFTKINALPNKNGCVRLGINRDFHARAAEVVQNIQMLLSLQNDFLTDPVFQSDPPRGLFDKNDP